MSAADKIAIAFRGGNFDAKIHFAEKNANVNYSEQLFVLVPQQISEIFKRRGRTSAKIEVSGISFETVLEPDGQLSHWFKIAAEVAEKAGFKMYETHSFNIHPLETELEPIAPDDFVCALEDNPKAQDGWKKTTTIARIGWVHWVETARQEKTRVKRINDAINMLEQGKLRVCCFDPSGYYSKAFSAPVAAQN